MNRFRKVKISISQIFKITLITTFILSFSYGETQNKSHRPEDFSGGNAPMGPPPGENTHQGQVPSMKMKKLDKKEKSEYFIDLDASTSAINAYVDYLFEKEIITDPEGNKIFRPKALLTRGEFAQILYNRYNYNKEGFSYGDISTQDYYYDAAMRGKACGVFENSKYFYPDKPVTKEQAIVWMYRSEINHGMPKEMSTSDVSAFNDSSMLSEEAKTAIGTLARMHIIEADKKGNFNPKQNIIRSDIVKILYHLSFLGGGPGGMGMMPGGAHRGVDHGNTANTVTNNVSGKTYESFEIDENALRVKGDSNISLTDIIIKKNKGNSKGGDASNFYGCNAGLLVMDGAKVTVTNGTVESTASGGNGIFSYGKGTKVVLNNCKIQTYKDNSGGIMVTGGGAMTINDSQIETQGRSSAALRSDRGGGTLLVNGGTYIAHGDGSPAIYSTANITVNDAELTATTSEAIVIEGKNSVSLKNCNVSGKMIKNDVENLQNVMIYQSMSGDAENGKSHFSMENGSLTSHNGDMIYVTNTSCTIWLKNVDLLPFNDVFLKIVGNDARRGWGVVGKNGGHCDFDTENQKISGNIIVDKISTLSISLQKESNFTGSINSHNEGGNINLKLDKSSIWSLTGDSYITSFSGSPENIKTNGYTLYINGDPIR